MNEFSDADFDTFLASAREQDARQTDTEAAVLAIRTEVSDALATASFIPIEDPARHDSLKDDVERRMREVDPIVSEEDVDLMVKQVEAEIGLKEDAAITRIQVALTVNKMTPKEGRPVDSTQKKRELYAHLLITEGIEPDDPIMVALNAVVPGEMVDPTSESMVPYIAEALQLKEEQDRHMIELDAEIRSIMLSVGIEETDPQWLALETDVKRMFLQAMPYTETNENRANLSATLHQMTVHALDSQKRQRLIAFFTTYKPSDAEQ